MEYTSLPYYKKIFLIKKVMRESIVSSKRAIKGRWTQEEHKAFIKACLKYGCNWKAVIFLKFRFMSI
jgi:hypothetical protein